MQVIDLIIKLQTLDPKLEVSLDLSSERGTMFKFGELVFCDKITDSLGEEFVMLSNRDYESIADEDDDEPDAPNYHLN